jgi:hypothetical protein
MPSHEHERLNIPYGAGAARPPGTASQSASARVDHFAFRIDDWDTERVSAELERRGLKGRLARGGALDTANYVSLTVQDPDGLGVQISGIARPGDSAYRQP